MTPRHHAREAALQILYFWEIGGAEPGQAIDAFFAEHQPEAADSARAFAATLVRGTIASVPDLDALIVQQARNWRLERLSVIDRLILRMAIWELQHESDTPPAVVLNEAIELARTFGSDDSVKFVNGVLDGIRKTLEVEGLTQRRGGAEG
jgi:transcription antitermination protein NusB